MKTVRSSNPVILAGIIIAAIVSDSSNCLAARLPPHPSTIAFDSLAWSVPSAEMYRHLLDDSLVVYIAEDHSLPLVTVRGHVRYGTISEPAGKDGIGAMLCQALRSGGCSGLPADTVDMLLDLFAVNASISISDTRVQFAFSFLSDYTDTVLPIIGRMLFAPSFDSARVEKERQVILERIRHRFNNPPPLLAAASAKAMYESFAPSRLATAQTVSGITREDLVRLHAELFTRPNMILGVSGKLNAASTKDRLNALVPRGLTPRMVFPDVSLRNSIRALVVHKPITQSYVRMLLPGITRPHPDYYACSILNHVLGGGSFSSRLNTSVRSDAGLTYSIYSDFGSNYVYPATVFINFFTKTETTTEAIRRCLEEITRIRAEDITPLELASAQKTLIETLPSMFRSTGDIVEHYTWNEYYGRAPEHYRDYPDSIRAITVPQVRAMAQKYLHPDSLVYVIVADTAALFASDTLSSFRLRDITPMRVISQDSVERLP